MGNVIDYVDWRGDIPFSVDPFNEADNLLLSELAYVDYEGIVPGPSEKGRISMDDVCDRFWETHTEEEERARTTFYRLAPFLLKKLKGSARFQNIELGRYVNQVSPENDEQISAVTFYLPDGTIYVAYRGTDNTIVGWKEDFCLSFMEATAGQLKATEYLNDLRALLLPAKGVRRKKTKQEPLRLRVGGHSKGGNFAVFAAAFCDKEVQDHITEIYTNDGPGFLKTVTETPEYQSILPRIRSFIPERSVFGLLLHAGYPYTVVHSTERGLYQHDLLSWQILRNRMVTVPERTEKSVAAEKALDSWIEGISMDERKVFVDALFDVIAGSGVETLGELKMDPVLGAREMLRTFRFMDSNEQKVMWDTLMSLVKTGSATLAEQMQEAFRRRFPKGKDTLLEPIGEISVKEPSGETAVQEPAETESGQSQEVAETEQE